MADAPRELQEHAQAGPCLAQIPLLFTQGLHVPDQQVGPGERPILTLSETVCSSECGG